MKKSQLLGVACVCAMIVIAPTSALAAITITSHTVTSDVEDFSAASDAFTGTTIPSSDTLTATANNSSSATNIDYSGDAVNATFHYDFDHGIDNTVGDTAFGDRARSYNDILNFTANTNATYSIDGRYDMLGPTGTRTYFRVFLQDATTGAFLFDDYSQSRSTANESFVLGVAGDGDYANTIAGIGNLTGNLIAGHDYKLNFLAYIQAHDGNVTQVAATADGYFNLNIISEPEPVPPITAPLLGAPAIVWLFGGLLAGFGVYLIRKQA